MSISQFINDQREVFREVKQAEDSIEWLQHFIRIVKRNIDSEEGAKKSLAELKLLNEKLRKVTK